MGYWNSSIDVKNADNFIITYFLQQVTLLHFNEYVRCGYACDPYQSDYVVPTQTGADNVVLATNFTIDLDYAQSIYMSCKNVHLQNGVSITYISINK